MQIHSLEVSEFNEENYYLIGIHTTLEDFKLAYLLNNNLKTQFKKASYTLDFQNKESKASFSVYSYSNEKYDFEWYLISNNYSEERSSQKGSLFFSAETKTYLIPEKKKVDYFIKIVGDAEFNYINKSIEILNKTTQIVTAYLIDQNHLKSKDYLIF